MGVFQFLSIFSPLLPIIFFILFRPNKSVKELWVVFFYAIFSFLEDILIFRYISREDTNLAFLVVTLIDYLFVSIILRLLLKSRPMKVALTVISILFVSYGIILFRFSTNTNSYTTTSPIESIIVIIFCIRYLFEQLNKSEEFFVYSTPGFWLVLGFLIFASGTLFLYIFRTIDFEEARKWWVINNTCNIILNFFIALAILINHRNSKSKNPAKEVPLYNN